MYLSIISIDKYIGLSAINLSLYQINFQPVGSKGPVKQDKVEVWISHMNDTCLSEQKGSCKDGRNPEANKRGGKGSFSLYRPT